MRHYYWNRLRSRDFWRKLLRGGVDIGRALRGLLSALRQSRPATEPAEDSEARTAVTAQNFVARMAARWQRCEAPSLVLLSGDDLVAAEFRRLCSDNPHWKARLSHPRVTCIELPGADHTCSSAQHRARVEDETLAFVQSLEGVASKR